MTRYRLPAVVLLALTAVLLAACGGGSGDSSSAAPETSTAAPETSTAASESTSEPASTASEPVEITLWHGQTETAAKTLAKLADQFNALGTGITVKAGSGGTTADNMLQKIEGALAGDKYPDIAYMFGSWAPNLAPSDKVADLAQAVQSPDVNWNDFPAAARETATVDGKVIGFPALIDNLAVVYNKKLFAAKGVAEPSADWTWDDFRATAKQLTGDGVFGTAYPGDASEDTVWRFWPMMWQGGGEITSPDLKQATFDNDAAKTALELLRGMAVDDKSIYIDPTNQKIEQLFNSDRIGMVVTGPWQLPAFVEAKKDYGTQVLPGFGDHQTIAGPDNWVVFNRDQAHVDAAVKFLTWLTAPEQDLVWASEAGALPMRASTQQAANYSDFTNALPGVELFVTNLANAQKARPPLASYPKISKAMGNAIVSVLIGKSSTDDALAKAQQEAQAIIDEG